MHRLLRLLGLLLAAALVFIAWMGYFATRPLALEAGPIEFTIKAGSTLRSASRQIEEAGVAMPAWQFTLLGRLLGKAAGIKAGSYEVSLGITPLKLLDKLTRGDVTQTDIVLQEGWTFRQMRMALDAHPGIRHDTTGLSEREIMEKLGVEGRAEGRFFPDTYLFARGSSDLDILKRSLHQMDKVLLAEWESREEGLPYASPYEALIMASIVEKETGQPLERTRIASVFLNRLKRGMLLQTDPTVIYGLGEQFDGNLRKRDLLADGPYNTYTRPGLPPTPIAMPGLAAIQAALHPARTEMLYFVARGDGSSQFSRTLEEHNRAVAKYQLRKGK
ncbi:MAG: endolytic transglycosylase MltG [Betaproteobacteria bacterium HGW-Betaproteobacteria-14]|nr:endolytic transglycosylase MltG [Rhodocyclaceae bacterium]MCB1892349.1 endolytic transglycosylase MltG [Rhodocyclaceae bacterium]MCP5296820.1 endolytic transglycosylase MltG [Zoogloeaceae bacterium]PKO71396.1 MAG: endolytic transglycosylase MltG [Betaproteobacteria bacterium HGW-Betaproteobacteria-14]PKO89281.1 MAG: endolytic transglycosylase MltG [Betaproteobacteria bacterium HGW-Betaproteobacteria-10]